MNITLEDFYSVLKDSVKYYPETGNDCTRLQGFRVLQFDGAGEVSLEAMGATASDADKPYFYSRKWEKTGNNKNKVVGNLPVLTAFEIKSVLKSPFDKNVQNTYDLILSVWDKYDQAKCATADGSCAGRTVNEIYRDTETMLLNVFYYISGIVLATTNIDDTPRLYHLAMLNTLKTDGYIASFNRTGTLMNTMQSQGQEFIKYRQESVSNFLYGTAIGINLRADRCQIIEFDFSKLDRETLKAVSGCTTC